MAIRKRKVNLTKVKEPGFISLVNSPANQSGFKVIRGEENQNQIVQTSAKRNDHLLSIQMTNVHDVETAKAVADAYGFSEDYDIAEENGYFSLRKKDKKKENYGQTSQISLGDGVIAEVSQDAFTSVSRSSTQDFDIPGVKIARFDFSSGYFGREKVENWIKKKDLDDWAHKIEEVDGGFVVTRSDYDASIRGKLIEVDEGVSAYAIRAEETDIPIKVYRAVIEKAYGSYGWGHLSFSAAMADPEFTNKSWMAIDHLNDVLAEIIIFSALSLDERKMLVSNALGEFERYLFGLMDTLPRDMLNQTSSEPESKSTQTEETEMTEQETVTRSDEKTVKDAVPPTTEKESVAETQVATEATGPKPSGKLEEGENQSHYVTKDELDGVVQRAVLAALKAQKTDTVDEVKTQPVEEKEEKKEEESELSVLRSTVKELVESVKTLAEAHNESVTITRSDEDAVNNKTSKSPFEGMFGKLQ